MNKKTTPIRIKRMSLGLNQIKFWSRIGVTQSGGSRYESGRQIRKPVQILLDIAYGTAEQHEAALKKLMQGEAPAPVKPVAKKEVRMATAAKKAAPVKKASPDKAPAKAPAKAAPAKKPAKKGC